jgi:hypothetical protein
VTDEDATERVGLLAALTVELRILADLLQKRRGANATDVINAVRHRLT